MSNLYQDITLLYTRRIKKDPSKLYKVIDSSLELSENLYPNLLQCYRSWYRIHDPIEVPVELYFRDYDLPDPYYTLLLVSSRSGWFDPVRIGLYSHDLSDEVVELLDPDDKTPTGFIGSVLRELESYISPHEYPNCKVLRQVDLNLYLTLKRDAYWNCAGINDYDINEFPNCWNQYVVSSDDLDKYRGVLMDIILIHKW